ncbi:MAG TPA: glycosyltransferase family 39 protein, partial [Chitinophagales bacterium]
MPFNRQVAENVICVYWKYVLLFTLMYVPIFDHLNSVPIQIWDEARLAINASEMYSNGNYIVTYFDGTPDMWNTKPPLLIWLQVGFMKLIGLNELAMRLPSAIAACFVCLALLFLSLRYLRSFWFGFIAVLVLITSNGYIELHGTRTGDYDSLLTMLVTFGSFSFFAYCETRKNGFLYAFFVITAFAVLTKSVAGLLFLPALFLYVVIQKELVLLLKNKHLYFGILLFLILVGSYYWLREVYNQGYLIAVYENELGGRYLNPLEGHKHHWSYYYDNMVSYRYSIWFWFLPAGLIVGLFADDKKYRRLTLFSVLIVIVLFTIISTAQTKLEWYDTPLYPFMAILVSVALHFIFQSLTSKSKSYAAYLFLFCVLAVPYKKIFDKTHNPPMSNMQFYELTYYLKNALRGEFDVNNTHLLYSEYNPQNIFYVKALNEKGI